MAGSRLIPTRCCFPDDFFALDVFQMMPGLLHCGDGKLFYVLFRIMQRVEKILFEIMPIWIKMSLCFPLLPRFSNQVSRLRTWLNMNTTCREATGRNPSCVKTWSRDPRYPRDVGRGASSDKEYPATWVFSHLTGLNIFTHFLGGNSEYLCSSIRCWPQIHTSGNIFFIKIASVTAFFLRNFSHLWCVRLVFQWVFVFTIVLGKVAVFAPHDGDEICCRCESGCGRVHVLMWKFSANNPVCGLFT